MDTDTEGSNKKNEFGQALREWRTERGMSRKQLEDAAGLGTGTVYAWEVGPNSRPDSRDTVIKIAKALSRDPEHPNLLRRNRLLWAAHYEEEPLPNSTSAPSPSPLGPCARYDFYEHISLPPNYVERAEVLADVRQVLLSKTSTVVLTSAAKGKPTAFHGMGGIGKSVIARALCDDPAVQAAFPDGILWATLGQTPDLVASMRQWVDRLGGFISENVPTIESLKVTLAQILKDRVCLLILDDVWQHTHADYFHVGGLRCRLLLTTRDAAIACELGAEVLSIPLMTKTQAIQLLEQWADGRLTHIDSMMKNRIVQRLGYLPLAIKLAGAQLRTKPPVEWLQTFDAHTLKSPRPETLHGSLERTFALSFDALDADTRHLYRALAIFKEDEATPETAIRRLWQGLADLDSDRTDDLIDDLAARALLDVTTDQSLRRVVLHDLIRELIGIELGEEGRVAHQALLGAYRTLEKEGGWPSVEDDGYLYDHLVYHLQTVSAYDELKALFADQCWLSVRVPQCSYSYDGYLDDLSKAWECADAEARQQIKNGQCPAALSDCIRYLLIRTSVNSLAGNHVPELVARAVETGLWTVDRALSVAAKVPRARYGGAMGRTDMYLALLKTGKLSKKQQEDVQWQVLRIALSMEDYEGESACRAVLAQLAPCLSREQCLAAITTLASTERRIRLQVLPALACRLSQEQCISLLQECLDEAIVQAEWWLLLTIARLAPYLSGDLFKRRLDAFFAQIKEWNRLCYLYPLAPYMSDDLLERGLDAALSESDPMLCAEAVEIFAPHMSEQRRIQTLQQLLGEALATPNERWCSYVLVELVPYLMDQQLEQVLQTAFMIPYEGGRADVLVALAPRLPQERCEQAMQHYLEGVLSPENEQLNVKQLNVNALVRVVPWLPERLRTQTLEWFLDVAPQIQGMWCQDGGGCFELASLIPHLTNELLPRSLEIALTDDVDLSTLMELIPRLTGDLREHAREVALETTLRRRDYTSLALLAPQLTDDQIERALRYFVEPPLLHRRFDYMHVLATLASQSPQKQYMHAVRKELGGMLAEAEDWLALYQLAFSDAIVTRSIPLAGSLEDCSSESKLVSQSPQKQRMHALRKELERLAKDEWRGMWLITLAPHLQGDLLEQVFGLALALEGLGHTEPEEWCEDLLAALAPQLTRNMMERALEAALRLLDAGKTKVMAALLPFLVAALAPQLMRNMLERALEAALRLLDVGEPQALAALLPFLEYEKFKTSMEMLLAKGEAWALRDVWVTVASKLDAPLLERSLDAAINLDYTEDCLEALEALAPYLTGDLLERTLGAVLTISDEMRRAGALVAISPQLRDDLLERSLEAVLALEDLYWRVEALARLAPQLRDTLLERALVATLALEGQRHIEERHMRSYTETVIALTSQLTEEQRAQIIEQEVETASVRGEMEWVKQLRTFASLEQGLKVALMPEESSEHKVMLEDLLPQLTGAMLERALEGVLAFPDEEERVRAFMLLAPRLSEQQRMRALETITQVTLEPEQAWRYTQALVPCLPLLSNPAPLLTFIWQVMLDYILSIQDWSCQDVYGDCFWNGKPCSTGLRRQLTFLQMITSGVVPEPINELFTQRVLSTETLGDIMSHMIEICQHWHWL